MHPLRFAQFVPSSGRFHCVTPTTITFQLPTRSPPVSTESSRPSLSHSSRLSSSTDSGITVLARPTKAHWPPFQIPQHYPVAVALPHMRSTRSTRSTRSDRHSSVESSRDPYTSRRRWDSGQPSSSVRTAVDMWRSCLQVLCRVHCTDSTCRWRGSRVGSGVRGQVRGQVRVRQGLGQGQVRVRAGSDQGSSQGQVRGQVRVRVRSGVRSGSCKKFYKKIIKHGIVQNGSSSDME